MHVRKAVRAGALEGLGENMEPSNEEQSRPEGSDVEDGPAPGGERTGRGAAGGEAEPAPLQRISPRTIRRWAQAGRLKLASVLHAEPDTRQLPMEGD